MVLLRKQVSAELKNVTPLASRSKHLHSTTLEYPQYERAATGIHVPAPHEFPMAVINLHSSRWRVRDNEKMVFGRDHAVCEADGPLKRFRQPIQSAGRRQSGAKEPKSADHCENRTDAYEPPSAAGFLFHRAE